MAHTYAFSPKGVLHHITWSLVRQYFADRHLLQDLPCLMTDEPDVEALGDAIQSLPHEPKAEVEQDLRDIYDLSDEAGTQLIAQEVAFAGVDFAAAYSNLEGHYDVATWALLNHEDVFAKVMRFHTADKLNGRYWRRRGGVPKVEPDVGQAARKRLSDQVTAYLVKEEGHGHHCQVEYVERSTGHMIVAYPEDFAETILEYEEEKLIRRKIKPARDLLFFYSPDSGVLEVFCKGTKERANDLMVIFAQIVLGIVLSPDPNAGRIYEVDLLKRPDFSFVIDRTRNLESIIIKSMFMTPSDGGKPVSIYPDGPPGLAVKIAASRYMSTDAGDTTDKQPLEMMDVVSARLQATFRPLGRRKRGGSKTFSISKSACPLDHDGRDGEIRRCLAASGIELKQPDLVAA